MTHERVFEVDNVPEDDANLRLQAIPDELRAEIAKLDIDDVLCADGIVMYDAGERHEVVIRMAGTNLDAGLMLAFALRMFVSHIGDVDVEELIECLDDFIHELHLAADAADEASL